MIRKSEHPNTHAKKHVVCNGSKSQLCDCVNLDREQFIANSGLVLITFIEAVFLVTFLPFVLNFLLGCAVCTHFLC